MNKFMSMLLLAACLLASVTACRRQDADEQALGTAQVFTLRTAIAGNRMVFLGVGGAIDGQANPDLLVTAGEQVRIVLQNGDGMMHDLAIPDLQVQTPSVMKKDGVVEATFKPTTTGTFSYICTISGHRQAGMEGTFIVQPAGS